MNKGDESGPNKEQKKELQYQARQLKKKAVVDKRIAKATKETGVITVITGNGKGKSTSGFGTIARALGHNLTVGVVQFIKGTRACGEFNMLKPHVEHWYVMGTGFTWETRNQATDIAAATSAWQHAKKLLADPSINMVLLDEITYMLKYRYIELEDVLTTLKQRPQKQHVLITGRACHRSILDLADTVSEVQPTKHAFEAGIKAQKGLDW